MAAMARILSIFVLALASYALAQQTTVPPNQAPPHSADDSASEQQPEQTSSSAARSDEESSSIAHRVDISPPKDDAKNHPFSSDAGEEVAPESASDVQEFHPWNPHKAAKDVEVGEFYLKRKNYRAAEARFREALVYKPNDAIASFRLGEALEKLGQLDEARTSYQGYLKILPDGPLSQDARKAMERLSKRESKNRQ
jgi:Flp pilus assembly protein TadD